MNRSLLPASLLLLAACSPAVDARYRGEPLVTVRGQLTLPSGATVADAPIRLALAWYPGLGGSAQSEPPRSIVTEEIAYQGTFPVSYTFSIYTLPPADALGKMSEDWGAARAGVGALIAYQDQNGNGVLDTIPPGGTPVDTVLGSSLGRLSGGPPGGYAIVYLDGAAPPDSPPEIQQGFNLVDFAGGVVPFSTSVPIDLTVAPELNILVCEEAWRGMEPEANSCIPRPPEPQCCVTQVMPHLVVTGSLGIVTNASSVNLQVSDGTSAVSAAEVTVNGRSIPFVASKQMYSVFDSGNPFLRDADTNEIQVHADGLSDLTLAVPMPGKFQVTAPAFNAAISSGSTVTVTWTASAGAKSYRVTLFDAQFQELFDGHTTAETLTTPAITYQGNATLNVEAEVDTVTTPEGSFVVPYVNTGRPLRFVP